MAKLDLITATEGDDESFETCLSCGSSAVTHRGLFVSTVCGPEVLRAAWCAAEVCQGDRALSEVKSVPVARTDTGYRVADTW